MTRFTANRERRVKVDDRYEVSDQGVVYSGGLPLEAIDGVGVNLHGKRVKIAYLVARAFVANAELREYVRHKNGDVRDNRAENLEWSSEKEEKKRGRKSVEVPIGAYNCEGELIGRYWGVEDASKATGVRAELIKSALRCKQRKAGGLVWIYLV